MISVDSCGDRPFKRQRASCALYGLGYGKPPASVNSPAAIDSTIHAAQSTNDTIAAIDSMNSGASLSTFIQVCRTLGKDEWIMRLGPADAVSIEDYAKRGGRPRVRAASSRKVVR